jgi:hypothetical protein
MVQYSKPVLCLFCVFFFIFPSTSPGDVNDTNSVSTNAVNELRYAENQTQKDSTEESSSAGSNDIPEDSTYSQKNAVRVFLDISSWYQAYIKTEITFVNYVRDRKEAQVHILHTGQSTGSGGTEHTLTFIGQQNYTGVNDTLKYVSKRMDTEELIRAGLVKTLKMGLMSYVAKTPLAENISISYNNKIKEEVVDKWNYWVYNIGGNGNVNGEESRKSYYFSGHASANKITPEWKLRFSVRSNYNKSTYEMSDHTVSSITRSQNLNGTIIKSLTGHWSAGVFGSATSSIYNNNELTLLAGPAIEYNIFPYSESTRREFRITYRTNYTNVSYNEETIFNKLNENLFNESLGITYEVKEKWGSVSSTLRGSNYFHDFSKNSLGLHTDLSLRLFEGLSLNLFGSYSRIHDQLSLPKTGATEEEILLHRKQLATQYDYYAYFGLSYTFGSIYTNIVNPRFGY